MAELQTHFEIVATDQIQTKGIADLLKKAFEDWTSASFEVREVAE